MRISQAQQRKIKENNLYFTGSYVSKYGSSKEEWEEQKAEAKAMRKLGYKAILVTGDTGRSIYAQKECTASKIDPRVREDIMELVKKYMNK